MDPEQILAQVLFSLQQDKEDDDMDDGLPNLSNAGDKIKGIFGDKISEETGVLVYGIVSWCAAILPLVIWLLANNFPSVVPYKFIVYVHEVAWFPFACMWIVSMFMKSELFQLLYQISLYLTLAGPWFAYWISMAHLLIYTDATSLWADAGMWISFAIFFIYTIFSMFFQTVFPPIVYKYIMQHAAGLVEGEKNAKAQDGETVVDDSVEEQDEPVDDEPVDDVPVEEETPEEEPTDETSIEEESPAKEEGEPAVVPREDDEFTELNLVADLIAF